MLTEGTLRIGIGWRATVARLLLLCVVVRALLPVGYMPSFGLKGDQSLHLVICLGDGGSVNADAAPGSPSQDGPGAAAHEQCAFSFLPRLFVPDSPGLVIAPQAFVGEAPGCPPLAHRFSSTAGPAVGSRAPPCVPRTIA